MSTCNEGFEELQALQRQKEEALARAARIEAEINRRQSGTAEVTSDEALVQRGLDDLIAQLDGDALQEWVATAMETRRKTSIASGGAQPNNFDQLIRSNDIRTAADYAALSKALLDTGVKLNPDQFKFVNETYGKEFVAQQVMEAYKELVGTEKLGLLLAQDVAPFMHLVERMTRLRVASNGFRKSLLEDIRQLAEYRSSSAAPVPADLKRQVLDSYKKALLSERHVDVARSRTGQTLRSLRDDLPDLDALRTQLETGEAFTPDPADADKILGIRPADIQSSELLADVIQAVDDTNAARGAESLRQTALIIELEGADPKSRIRDHKWFNKQMKLGNLLAKDAQLFNWNTQLVANGGSNVAMMILGPARQAFENVGVRTSFGTALSREAWQKGFASSWAGTKTAWDVVRTSGMEVFRDAVLNGRTVFAGNADTFGKQMPKEQALLAQLRDLLDMPYESGGFPLSPFNLKNWGLARNKIHAAYRLFLYENYKLPILSQISGIAGRGFLLEPGLRMLGAVDNVAGLYHHAFKVRNDLEMRARWDGPNLGLDTPQKTQDWIDAEFDKAFYGLAPTEHDVKSYRRELGLSSEISDDDIKVEILSKRVGETYGGPTLGTPESINAEQYSRELRFQNRPGDLRGESTRGQLAGDVYDGVQKTRSNWLVDLQFPYLQSPMLGAFLDMNLVGITPLIDEIAYRMNPGGFTKAQRARVKANWVVAGTIWSSFLALDAAGLIIGNGPIDAKERQEWEADLQRRGLVANSIAGVPFMGGVPVLSTLFLLKDVSEAVKRSNLSAFDQYELFLSGMQVLTGQLMRQTSLGQFTQLMNILNSPTQSSKQRQAVSTIGYMGGSQLPQIGLIRDAGRAAAVSGQTYYQDQPGRPGRDSMGGEELWDKGLRLLQDLASGAIPLTNLAGGVRKGKDWLGSPINIPFGMRYAEALKHRFFPQLWPDDKVYAELDAQNLLNPPAALMSGELDGVPMTAELQGEYAEAYSTVKGESSSSTSKGGSMTARLKIAGSVPNITVSSAFRTVLPSGAIYSRANKTLSVPVAPLLEEHVRGRTALEAFRSVINSPLYKAFQSLPGTSSDYAVQDRTAAERRGTPGQILLSTVKRYYGLLAMDAIANSSSPDAQQWREMAQQAFAERNEGQKERLNGIEKALQLSGMQQ